MQHLSCEIAHAPAAAAPRSFDYSPLHLLHQKDKILQVRHKLHVTLQMRRCPLARTQFSYLLHGFIGRKHHVRATYAAQLLLSSIKRIADGFNIAILLVHHLRKLQDSDDPFNDVSGSTGIIGAADTNFILRRKRSGNAATLLVSGRDVEYQELTLQFNDLVWELVERKNSEDIHKAELPKFLFRVVDFMECRTEWVGTATELLTEMKEQEVTPNMVTKYLGQFAYEVLEPLGIEYRTKRTGKSRLIKFLRCDGDDANDAGIAI